MFSTSSVLMSGTREQRALLALTMLDAHFDELFYEDLLSSHLDWPWIFMQALDHKVVYLLWDNLKRLNLVNAALRAGISRRWIIYAEQLSYPNVLKNQRWLEMTERIFADFSAAGISAVCLKGGALIGDIYHAGNRMISDIDTMIGREHLRAASDLLKDKGFRHGSIDPTTGDLKPMPRNKQRFWSFHSHVLPKFYGRTGNDQFPYLKFSVGVDFFDPTDRYSVPSDAVVANRQMKSEASNIFVPDDVDTLINICAHIYREGVSSNYAYVGDNWQITKFCDLRTFLRKHRDNGFERRVAERVASFGVEQPFYFAMYYLDLLYGDSELGGWLELVDPGDDKSFLFSLVDGSRSATFERPFVEKFFDRRQFVLPGAEPKWYDVVKDDEW